MKSGHLDGNPSAFFMPVFNCIVFFFPNQEFTVNYFISLLKSHKMTHKINNVEIKDDYVVADMELIDTPNTKHLVEMLDAHKLYGTCSVMTDGKEIFNLQSISITMNPSDALKNFPLTRVEKDDAE